MSKELVISANRHETRVAVLEDDQVVEVFYQRENEYSLAGSIHKGRVTRVLPGMQSAFVDIGLGRDAFLYVSDFFEDNDEYDKIVTSVEEKVLKLDRAPVAQVRRRLVRRRRPSLRACPSRQRKGWRHPWLPPLRQRLFRLRRVPCRGRRASKGTGGATRVATGAEIAAEIGAIRAETDAEIRAATGAVVDRAADAASAVAEAVVAAADCRKPNIIRRGRNRNSAIRRRPRRGSRRRHR